MKCACPTATKLLTGFFVTAMYAMPQGYTISAKPGVVNYIEGNAFLNGRPISAQSLKATFVNGSDTISTDIGKAEVLLTPGVFLRLGNNTQVRMVSPSLTDTQLELKAGEAMIEADDIVKDSRVSMVVNGNTAVVDKNGLYRFRAGDSATAAVLEGKLSVFAGDRKTEVGKGHEVLLAQNFKTEKFNAKDQDDLYAWSNVRSEYSAASSYQAAKDVNASSYGGVWGGYGYSGFQNTGWLWNSGFNSWAWLPGNNAYYSPFGYGFYGPGVVAYAPVMYAPLGGGYYAGRGTAGGVRTAAVPVNPVKPPAASSNIASPVASQAARNQTLRSYSSSGFRTASGAVVPAGHAAAANYGGGGHAVASGAGGGASGGGFSGARASSGVSAASAGGGHAGGGVSGGGAHR